MFYGKMSGGGSGDGGNGKGGRQERFDQMMKQQQLIEQKKREIQAKLESDRLLQVAATGASISVAGASASSTVSASPPAQSIKDVKEELVEEKKPQISQLPFNNDGSFLERFKKLQEEAAQKKREEQEIAAAEDVKVKQEPVEYDDYGTPINKDRGRNSGYSKRYYEVPPPPPPPPPPGRPQQHNMNTGQFHIVPPPPPPPIVQKIFGFPSPQVKALAGVVAEQGDYIEEELRNKHQGDPLMWFLNKPESTEYKTFRSLVAEIKADSRSRNYNQAPPPPVANIKADYRNRSYNQAPPPPPPQVMIKKEEPRIKVEPRSPQPTASNSSAVPPSTSYTNFVKADPSLVKSDPNLVNVDPDSVKVDPSLVKVDPSVVKTEPSFVKIEPSFVKIEPSFMKADSTISNSPPEVSSSQPMTGIKREAPTSPEGETEQEREERREKRRKSRWGPQASGVVPPVGLAAPLGVGQTALAVPGAFPVGAGLMNMPLMPMGVDAGTIVKVTRANPQLVAYAQQAYGRIDLDEDEWKQCEEAYKMNMVFQDIARKKAQDEELAKAGKVKYEYDSDEEVDGGTWEHKQRMKEMEKTRNWADELTQKAKGKHHIGDFLPPEQLAKFMEKYKAVKEGVQLDESEYQEYKLQQDNIGFKMLQKMGWSAGEGLGVDKQGIVAPIDKGNAPSDKQGLGVEKPGELNDDDDEYAAYRKRMMLAYRFRPNPMNNPRRAYY